MQPITARGAGPWTLSEPITGTCDWGARVGILKPIFKLPKNRTSETKNVYLIFKTMQ